jgi:protein subunit release factor B
MITETKWKKLRQWMDQLNILNEDLKENFILGSGSGGQKIQKTASCVQLHHLKSDIIIKCSESRLREQNRYYARMRLCEKIETEQLGEKSKQRQAFEKIRRQKSKRSKRAKNKIMDDKRIQGKTKSLRKPPKHDD